MLMISECQMFEFTILFIRSDWEEDTSLCQLNDLIKKKKPFNEITLDNLDFNMYRKMLKKDDVFNDVHNRIT